MNSYLFPQRLLIWVAEIHPFNEHKSGLGHDFDVALVRNEDLTAHNQHLLDLEAGESQNQTPASCKSDRGTGGRQFLISAIYFERGNAARRG